MNSKKIAIIGNAGSGKTTLAFQLRKKLKLPLYHLDQYYWKPGWQRPDFEEFSVKHVELCDKEEWIIEGIYFRTLLYRLMHADTIIFLDMPRYWCLWNVIKRAVLYHGKIIPGNPEGCKQRLVSVQFLEFLKWVWSFYNRNRPMILDMLTYDELKEKRIYILKSPQEIATVML